MLTGEKPYTGEHLTTVVYKIVAEEPVPPHRLNPTLSTAIETALRKAMAKRPEARYRNCQEFIGSLEAACLASQGWKPMPRGGSMNEPTLTSVRPTVTLAPPRRIRHGETTAAPETGRKRIGFVPFLIVILLAAAVLVVVGPRIPWQSITAPPPQTLTKTTPPAPAVTSPPVSAPPEVAPPVSEDVKPSPLGPTERTPPTEGTPLPEETQPAKTAEPPARRPPARAVATAQEVLISTSPSGATATLDGNTAVCTTPCSLNAGEIVVSDSHGNGENLLIELFPADVRSCVCGRASEA
jgi:serine/threonine-protein kinase